ncbi:ComF family protein, partial [Patescibacteria group bacterium]|nr:ComF family protein [Patescibacteria group bacterium]
KIFLLDLLFPKLCLNCQKEGDYLCSDCQALLDVLEFQYCLCKLPQRLPEGGKCKRCQNKNLSGLYFALSYQKPLTKILIHKFKYEPFIKELSKTLSDLIINHFQLLNKLPNFSEFALIPIPLDKKRLKWRGVNQAEELAKELSEKLEIPLLANCLIKIKTTFPQVELSEKQREENVKGVFACRNKEKIVGKKILLVDDVYTTGATMEEAARVLKKSGARKVWGLALARG